MSSRSVFASLAVAYVVGAAPCAAQGQPIGLVVPSRGAQSESGSAIRAGVELAVADWVAADPSSVSIAIEFDDDGCSSAGGVEVATRMRARSVGFVIGHPCPGAAVAAAKVYAAAGITFMAPATGHPRLTDARAGPTIFRLAGRSDADGAIAAAFLAQRYRGQRVAVISDRSAYGQSVAEAARAALVSAGMNDIVTGHVKPAQKEYGSLVSGFKAASVKAIVYGGFPTEAFVLADGLRNAGVDAAIVLGEVGGNTDAMMDGRASAYGLLVTMRPDPTSLGPAAQVVLKRLQERGAPATLEALQAYAAVEVWRAATDTVKSEGGTARVGVSPAAAIGRGAFATAAGAVSFDHKGDARIASRAVYRWDGSRFEQIWLPSR